MVLDESVFVKEVARHQARYSKLISFTSSSTKGAVIMVLAAACALVISNSPVASSYEAFWSIEVGFSVNGVLLSMPLLTIVNDILMAIFFLLIGLDIKHEVIAGDLNNPRKALLPIIAACGGVLVPASVYLILSGGLPEVMKGWGIPTATDIAFAIGILSLLGSRVPRGIVVFLSTLAVADDIIAIIVIAVFYGHSPSIFWLIASIAIFLILLVMNRCRVYAIAPYLLVGILLWICVFLSGIHPTIAGVLLAFSIPSGTRINLSVFASWVNGKIEIADRFFSPESPPISQVEYLGAVRTISVISRQVVPPLKRLSNKLFPCVFFFILPVFAFANAGVSFGGGGVGAIVTNPVFLGVFFGLLIGKPVGIVIASAIAIKAKLAAFPEGVRWPHVIGSGILGGIGFTMAIFVANLAFASPELIADAKVAIVFASLIAAIAGFVLLSMYAKFRKNKESSITFTADIEQD